MAGGGIGMEVEWDGLDAFIGHCSSYASQTPSRIADAIAQIGDDSKKVMDGATPVRTGNLKSHNALDTEAYAWELSNDCIYAPAVEYGSKRNHAHPFLEAAIEYAAGEINTLEDAVSGS